MYHPTSIRLAVVVKSCSSCLTDQQTGDVVLCIKLFLLHVCVPTFVTPGRNPVAMLDYRAIDHSGPVGRPVDQLVLKVSEMMCLFVCVYIRISC